MAVEDAPVVPVRVGSDALPVVEKEMWFANGVVEVDTMTMGKSVIFVMEDDI